MHFVMHQYANFIALLQAKGKIFRWRHSGRDIHEELDRDKKPCCRDGRLALHGLTLVQRFSHDIADYQLTRRMNLGKQNEKP